MRKIVNISVQSENNRIKQTLWHKLLPVFLVLSFFVYAIPSTMLIRYSASGAINGAEAQTVALSFFISNMLVYGILALIVFELLLFGFRFLTGFSIFTYTVPPLATKDYIKTAIIFRNVVMAIVEVLFLLIPFAYALTSVIDLIVIFACASLAIKKLVDNYADLLIAPFTFRGFMLPFLICIFIYVGILILEFVI